jgi:hypothetical protein
MQISTTQNPPAISLSHEEFEMLKEAVRYSVQKDSRKYTFVSWNREKREIAYTRAVEGFVEVHSNSRWDIFTEYGWYYFINFLVALFLIVTTRRRSGNRGNNCVLNTHPFCSLSENYRKMLVEEYHIFCQETTREGYSVHLTAETEWVRTCTMLNLWQKTWMIFLAKSHGKFPSNEHLKSFLFDVPFVFESSYEYTFQRLSEIVANIPVEHFPFFSNYISETLVKKHEEEIVRLYNPDTEIDTEDEISEFAEKITS